MKTEIQEQCTICYEIIDSKNPTKITEEILSHLKLLNTNINTALLHHALICGTCLVKIKSACKFKTSYLDLQKMFANIITEEEGYSQTHVVCEICKNTIDASDTIPLLDPIAKTNKLMLVNYLSSELELKIDSNPKTCESCHKSMLTFCNITNLLSIFDKKTYELHFKKTSDENELACVNIKTEPRSTIANYSESCDIEIKEEMRDVINEKDVEYAQFLAKNEELDLKMDCEEEIGDERTTTRIEEARNSNEEKFNRKSKKENSDTINVFQCDLCDFKTSQKKMLNTHMLSHTFHCNLCQHKTHYKRNLKLHMLVHKTPDETESFQCEMCEFKTKYKRSIIGHISIHKKPDEIEMFHCIMCEYKTRRKDVLKNHMTIHTPEETETFQCQICEYKTKRKDTLKRHMLVHQSLVESEMFQCEMCEFKTKHKRSLLTHMSLHKKSVEVKMFQCQICEFNTRRKDTLKNHMIIHKQFSETEIFQCEMCDYKTKHKSTLKKHMLVHKKIHEIASFQCEICKFKTKRKHCLLSHMLRHKKPDEIEMFQCEMCEFKTKHKKSIIGHMNIHKNPDEIEMFQCKECEYKTRRKYHLKRHMSIHKKSK